MKKLQKLRKNRKGFTLVELIVVLVILAILAAMLVPALLGYIDKAKAGKYNEEMHSIYTALQVINDERYAKGRNPLGITGIDGTPSGGTAYTGELDELNDMISPTKIEAKGEVVTNTVTAPAKRDDYTVRTFAVVFQSQDGNYVSATFDHEGTITIVNDGAISTTKPSDAISAPTVPAASSTTPSDG